MGNRRLRKKKTVAERPLRGDLGGYHKYPEESLGGSARQGAEERLNK